VLRYEKGVRDPELDHVDAGLLALRRSAVLAPRCDELLDLAELQRDLARAGALLAHRTEAPTFELGSHAGRIALDAALAGRT
jgi:hypothetical protein